MEEYTKFEKIFYTFLIALCIFIAGIQIGIAHGKELQKQDFYYDYNLAD